ncbi:MAG TPA: nucleotidyltransferase family protein [Thermodesulfovibrionales bacterium]|nr:nucleotidyltransferase family protein [Thermodesulfovibrionales bacterium]
MNTEEYGGSWKPSPQQELLLRAALLTGTDAIEAWQQWKSSVDVEDLDPGSHRMLPLLYRNLQVHGIKDPSMSRYKGVYRQTWYKNQLLFHALGSVLRSFGELGIETVVLKGAALTVLNYKDFGLRPMNDFDVLVRVEHVLPAMRLLQDQGWIPTDFEPNEKYISVRHSHGFRNGKGQEIDLHWHVLSQSREMDADNDFWDGAITVNIRDAATRALNPTDQLLQVCIHGAKWNYTPPFRWVADAMSILNTARSEVDWNRLIEQSMKRRLLLPLRGTLSYLKDLVAAPIPPEILGSIEDISVSRIESLEHKINISPRTRWIAVLDLWCQHSRLMKNSNVLHRLFCFPIFLQSIWGRSLWKLPFYGLSKAMNWHKNPLAKRL